MSVARSIEYLWEKLVGGNQPGANPAWCVLHATHQIRRDNIH